MASIHAQTALIPVALSAGAVLARLSVRRPAWRTVLENCAGGLIVLGLGLLGLVLPNAG